MILSRMCQVGLILAGLALGCAAPQSAQAVDQKPSSAAPTQTVPEDTAPGRSGSSREPLGKKLDRTDGVLHPPSGIDPGVTIPPPSTGSNMPVIAPPGTPGGDPAIEPK